MVKNPPANAGDTGSIPGPGRSLMPWSTKPPRPNYCACALERRSRIQRESAPLLSHKDAARRSPSPHRHCALGNLSTVKEPRVVTSATLT